MPGRLLFSNYLLEVRGILLNNPQDKVKGIIPHCYIHRLSLNKTSTEIG